MVKDKHDQDIARVFACSEFEAQTLRLGDSLLYKAICALGPVHIECKNFNQTSQWVLRSTQSGDRDQIIEFWRSKQRSIHDKEESKT